MPTLDFDGKEIIHSYHFSVPYRPLVPDAARSLNPVADGEDNLIIHGDNLHALKALLPCYAGRVKCIYIDPPYNTGNERWAYNDKVNNPRLREWFQKEIGRDDLERHDKWACMIWPRLQLLRELLADDGVIFVSIDDNEQHHLRMLMDEIFGDENNIAQLVIQTNPRGRSLRRDIAQTHEYVLMYAKDINIAEINMMPKSQEQLAEYDTTDDRGRYRLLRLRNTGIQFFNRETRPNLFFPIYVDPATGNVSLSMSKTFSVEVLPVTDDGIEGCWTWSKDKIDSENAVVIGQQVRGGAWRIYRKDYLEGESLLTRAKSIFGGKEVNHEVGKEMLTKLVPTASFDHPKSPGLVAGLVRLACGVNGIVLDSFAGSGTTAHAVQSLNKEDGGNRKFILVECEDYADSVTAERVRRVINGVPGAKDKSLREGLGGSFTYCTLGNPLEVEGMLNGDLPEFGTLAAYLLYTAGGITSDAPSLQPQNEDGLFYSDGRTDYYLIYQPSVDWLRSAAAALTAERAQRIRDASRERGRSALVYAACKYIGQRALTRMGSIRYCQLPYEMHHSAA